MIEIFAGLRQSIARRRCDIVLEGLPAQVRPTADLRFDVVLRAGPRELPVRELRVALEEERLIHLDPGVGEFKFWDTTVRTILPLPRTRLAAHASARVPVHLPLPELAPSQPLRRYRLLVVADVPGFNPRVSTVIEVVEVVEVTEGASRQRTLPV